MDWFDLLRPWFEQGSYFIVFTVLVLCGIGLPVPEEVSYILAGWVVARLYPEDTPVSLGFCQIDLHFHLWLMILVCLVGLLIGDSLMYMFGRRHGTKVLARWPLRRLLSPARVEKARQFFSAHGAKAVFLAGFLAGVRAPTYFLAGTMGVGYFRFIFWDAMRSCLTCPISIWLGFKFGRHAEEILQHYRPWVFGAVGCVVLAVLARTLWHVYKRRKTGAGG